MTDVIDIIKKEQIEKATDEIVDAVDYFTSKLKKTGLQYSSIEAFGRIVAEFGEWMIALRLDAE